MLKDFSYLTTEQRMNAYAAIKERFDLKHAQRDKLDADPMLDKILFAAHNEQWITTQMLLDDARII